MSISDTWDEPFEEQLEAETFISKGDNIIRNTRRAIEERFMREHDLDLSDQTDHGLHSALSTRLFSSASATRPDGTALDGDDTGRMAIVSGVLKVWDGSSWLTALSRYPSYMAHSFVESQAAMAEYPRDTAEWLDTLNLAVNEQIACTFIYIGYTSPPLTVVEKTVGGSIRKLPDAGNPYFLVGCKIVGNPPYSYQFNTSSSTPWHEVFKNAATSGKFWMSIVG